MTAALDALAQGKSLAQTGELESAILLLRRAADGGLGEACIELVRIERERGNDSSALAWLKKAEDIANKGDPNANLSCHFAYQLMFGEGTLEEQQYQSNKYLRKAAELGSPVAQTMFAQQLLWGLNGEAQNEAEYYRWIDEAIGNGLDEALITHVRNMLRLRRLIDRDLESKLELLATRSDEARKLLKNLRTGGSK